MKVTLYNTNSSNNTINKVLTDPKVFDRVVLKDITDILQPTLKIKSDTELNYNYCYIPSFNRYYFINTISIFPNRIYHIELRCDVLESFKNDILNCDGMIVKQSNSNNYYNVEYETEVKKEVQILTSDTELEPNNEIILITIGGVK